jgi:hypothetical protein
MSVRFKLRLVRVTLVASVGFAAAQLIFAANAFGQEPTAPGVAEVERVIVTGSNISTALGYKIRGLRRLLATCRCRKHGDKQPL